MQVQWYSDSLHGAQHGQEALGCGGHTQVGWEREAVLAAGRDGGLFANEQHGITQPATHPPRMKQLRKLADTLREKPAERVARGWISAGISQPKPPPDLQPVSDGATLRGAVFSGSGSSSSRGGNGGPAATATGDSSSSIRRHKHPTPAVPPAAAAPRSAAVPSQLLAGRLQRNVGGASLLTRNRRQTKQQMHTKIPVAAPISCTLQANR